MSFLDKLRHAFAVDPPGPVEPNDEQKVPVDWVCKQVTKRHLTTPGLIALEMTRPLNFVFAQGMHLCEPAVWAITTDAFHANYKSFASFLEHRGSVEYLCRRIEQMEQEYEGKETPPDEQKPSP